MSNADKWVSTPETEISILKQAIDDGRNQLHEMQTRLNQLELRKQMKEQAHSPITFEDWAGYPDNLPAAAPPPKFSRGPNGEPIWGFIL